MIGMNERVKFGIIGCGRIAQRHAEHISKKGELVAVCDNVKEKADQFAAQYQTKAYYSVEEFLSQSPSMDVVAICSPNGLHAEHSIKVLQAGFHALCEKPMAITTYDCGRMIQAAEKANKRLFAIKQNRYNPPVAAVVTGRRISTRESNPPAKCWAGTLAAPDFVRRRARR